MKFHIRKIDSDLSMEEVMADFHQHVIKSMLEDLETCGIPKESKLPLDFFFALQDQETASFLAKMLSTKGYAATVSPARPDGHICVFGRSVPMVMNEEIVTLWLDEMNQLAARFNARLEGWGNRGKL
jgi:hypothetical protein